MRKSEILVARISEMPGSRDVKRIFKVWKMHVLATAPYRAQNATD